MNTLNRERRLSKLQTAACLCSAPVAQLGWAFLALGSIASWIYLPRMDLSPLTERGAVYASAEGRVLRVEKTKSQDKSFQDSEPRPVYANYFQFSANDASVEGVSYSVGRTVEPGASVAIEYIEGHLEGARIAGQRRKPFSMFVSFVIIFPLFGAVMALDGSRVGRTTLHLLRRGIVTRATFLGTRNKWGVCRPQFRGADYTFRFRDHMGLEHQAVACSLLPYNFRADKNDEIELVYDALEPKTALPLKLIPGGMSIRADDSVTNDSDAYLLLATPTIAICANVIGPLLLLLA